MGGRGRRHKFSLSKGGCYTMHAEMRGVSGAEVSFHKWRCPPFFLQGIPRTPNPGSGPRQMILFLLHTSPTGLSSEGFTSGVCETRELLDRLHTEGKR